MFYKNITENGNEYILQCDLSKLLNARNDLIKHAPFAVLEGGTSIQIGSDGQGIIMIEPGTDEKLGIYVMNNSFIQTTGNSHIESHGADVILRDVNNKAPWLD